MSLFQIIMMVALTALTCLAIFFSIKYTEKVEKRVIQFEKDSADLIFSYHELEKRVIALEHFKEDVGTEILETVQEQKKQEQKISEGMDNIFSYTSQGKKDK